LVVPPFSDNVNQHTSAHSIRGMSPPIEFELQSDGRRIVVR
jgi:hypothetical protein